MLNFLRQEIAKKEKEQKAFHAQEESQSDQMDEAILEYAHLFSEMEELTLDGENALRERPVINIPIEDDIELDLVEMDITSGRIVDVPMDVQSVAAEAFAQQFTFEDFYQEAARITPRLARDSAKAFEQRVMESAKAAYERYHAYIVQEGLFGNDMIKLSDARVPAKVIVDLGPLHLDNPDGKHYTTKLPVFFEVNKNNEVSLNQIHALTVAENLGAFESLGEALRNLLIRDGYRKQLYNADVWDVATPERIIIPVVMDKYVVCVEFDVDEMKDPYYVTWAIETKRVHYSKKGDKVENAEELKKKLMGDGDEHTYPNVKVADKDFTSLKLLCKKDFKESEEKAIKESFNFKPKRGQRLSFYQEAIDFGGAPAGGDPAAGGPPAIDAGGGAPTPGGTDPMGGGADPTTGGGAPPTIDAGGGPMGGTDPSATGTDPNAGGTPPTDTTSTDASTATTNDVSQQIADNVANATAANTSSSTDIMNTTPTFDDNVDDTFSSLDSAMGGTDSTTSTTDTSTTTPDLGNTDSSSSTSTDTSTTDPLGDLGGSSPAESLDDIKVDDIDTKSSDSKMGNVDIDNMSMDDLIAQGIEKIKTMPIGQLKEFIGDGGGITSSSSDVDDLEDDLGLEQAEMDVEDAEFQVELEAATSISNKVNICIRKVLGDLNDTKKSLSGIFKSVKRDSKHLNRSLNQAIKSEEFDNTAKSELTNLTHALNEMVLKLNETPGKDEVEGIKDAIRNFTGATRRVSKHIDLGKPVMD